MGCLAAIACVSNPLIESTQAYLVSPSHILQQLHGQPSAKPNALYEAKGDAVFAPEQESDRLVVGPQLARDGSWYLGTSRS
jgi:hypothetical protein